MISKLEIKGFKSLLDVSIELGAVNVFIGANGSGKSNLLEAVGVLGAASHGSIEPESLKYRGVRLGLARSFTTSLKAVVPSGLSIQVSSPEVEYIINIEDPRSPHALRWNFKDEILSEGARLLLRSVAGGREIFTLEFPPQRLIVSPDESAARLAVQMQGNASYASRNFLELLENFAIYTPSTSVMRQSSISTDDVSRNPIGLSGSGLGVALRQMIEKNPSQFGPFDLEDVYELIDWAEELVPLNDAWGRTLHLRNPVEEVFLKDRFMKIDRNILTAIDASEGALYVLFLLALVGHEDSPKFFAVDNFDQALHPRLARALTEMICDQILADGSRQMLATTHNPLVLDGLDLLDDRVRLFTVDRDQTGASQVKRVRVTEELMALADQGMSLSRLWVSGRLGGVPKSL